MITTPDEQLADRILSRIRRSPLKAYSYVDLAKGAKATVDQVADAVRQIQAWGYKPRVRKQTIAFVRGADLLTATEIRYGLKTKLIGKQVVAYGTVRSTNDLASQMADNGAPEGTIVTAEQQTKGRGRFGRSWHSPAGLGIYLSIILRPKFPPERAPGVSLMTALAVADTIARHCKSQVQVKWPNDILIGGKKTSGILTELSAERGHIDHLIVGIGINVNHGVAHFPEELRTTATSVRRALRRKVNRVGLLRELLVRFEAEYAEYQKHGLKNSQKRLRKYSSLLGKTIQLASGTSIVSGQAIDIDANGCLIVESAEGRHQIVAGEVTVVKE